MNARLGSARQGIGLALDMGDMGRFALAWNDMVWVVALVPLTSQRVVVVVATAVVAM